MNVSIRNQNRLHAPMQIVRAALLIAMFLGFTPSAHAAQVFLRFKITQPAAGRFRVVVGGFRHRDPWTFPETSTEVDSGAWSDWIDLSKWA